MTLQNSSAIKSTIKNNYLLIAFLATLLYELPYIILGEDSHIYINDNLDSFVSAFLLTIREGKLFHFHTYIEHIMNGLPNECLANGVNISVLWYVYFSPFVAYLLNDFAVHLIAFTGMYLLLNDYVLRKKEDTYLIVLIVSLCFCYLPFFSIYGISIAGQPLLLWAILNLQNSLKKWISYSIVLLFPLYSMLVFVGVFIIASTGCYFLFLWLIKKSFKIHVLFALLLLVLTYVLAEFPLLNFVLFSKQLLSHRAEWNPIYSATNLTKTFSLGFDVFVIDHFHAISNHILILLFSLFTLALFFYNKKTKTPEVRSILFLLTTLFLFSMAFAFYNWEALMPLKNKITILKVFQVSRVIWLTPFIWYVLFAICLYSIINLKYGKFILLLVAILQLTFILLHHSELQHYTRLVYKKTGAKISYRQFFSEDLFKEIKDYINLPQENYRIVSIGLHPAIPQYSGFYTLDSYQNNYLLSYKHDFRKIIAKELDKSPAWKEYFDYWGNRCYIFSSEIPKTEDAYILYKELNLKLSNLELNTSHFKQMGGRYIFSCVEVLNAGENNLKLLKIFEKDNLPWRIYLYEAI